MFVDFEVARLVRSGLPDETHIDATAGVTFLPNWQLFIQSYTGRADSQPHRAGMVQARGVRGAQARPLEPSGRLA